MLQTAIYLSLFNDVPRSSVDTVFSVVMVDEQRIGNDLQDIDRGLLETLSRPLP
jgi:hypothetical protein